MKIISLVIGLIIMLLSGVAFVFCMLLPALTSNKINFKEVSIFLVLAALVFIFGTIVTIASGIWMLVTRKKKVAS